MHHNLINRKWFIETGLPLLIKIKKAPNNASVEAIQLTNILVRDPKIGTQTDLVNEPGIISHTRVNQIIKFNRLRKKLI